MFDRFAGWTSAQVAKAPFFTACLALVILWIPSFPLFEDTATYHLALNSPTTALSFLLLALLTNTTARSDKAIQQKVNALADGLADLSEVLGTELDAERLHEHAHDLRAAVGLEDRVHS